MVLLLGLVLAVLTGCSGPKAEPVTALQQLNAPSMRIGVVSDTNDDEIVARKLPRATVEYVKDSISGYVAVSQGKLDGFVYAADLINVAIRNGQEGIRLLDKLGEGYPVAIPVSDHSGIPDLEEKLNQFLEKSRQTERWQICMTGGWSGETKPCRPSTCRIIRPAA